MMTNMQKMANMHYWQTCNNDGYGVASRRVFPMARSRTSMRPTTARATPSPSHTRSTEPRSFIIAFMFRRYVVMAYKAMAYVAMGHGAMAYIVMAYIAWPI